MNRIEAWLDQRPDDWEARLVLSDAYEEAGDLSRARFHRWAALNRSCPKFTAYFGQDWGWYYFALSDDRLDTATLGTELFMELMYRHRRPEVDTNRPFATRLEAEDCLRTLLEKKDYPPLEGRHDCDPVPSHA